MELTDSIWEIIKTNSKSLDGKVWYGVKSTKIFCKPSCPSRIPNKSNVLLFTNLDTPVQNGFRPCKRCQSIDEIVSDDIWVDEINYILESYYDQNLTLAELSVLAHGSISHLRHVYQSKTGISPSEKLMQIRMDKAEILLQNTKRSIGDIGNDVGIPNNSYFIKLFKKTYGVTPHQYRVDRIN
ncbi:MAG: Ada metal-binding domain-containing protein [Liquorilactobacillus hordei]|uniref:Ada metal-binding domain-containing protein n=1 Tax=Liquorilactobacillus hordei TaxID=468911 RepID=UPI0039ECE301